MSCQQAVTQVLYEGGQFTGPSMWNTKEWDLSHQNSSYIYKPTPRNVSGSPRISMRIESLGKLWSFGVYDDTSRTTFMLLVS